MVAQITVMALPLDLQLLIWDHLTWIDYVAFALAGYHGLRYRHADRFPSICRIRIKMINSDAQSECDPLNRLPNELIEHIATFVDRKTLMSWVFAHYPVLELRQLVPALTAETLGQLCLTGRT